MTLARLPARAPDGEATMHPLPRTLEPASGESLVSYLLRLGHRLSLPPLQLIRAAGWTDRVQATHIPGSLLLNLTGRRPKDSPD